MHSAIRCRLRLFSLALLFLELAAACTSSAPDTSGEISPQGPSSTQASAASSATSTSASSTNTEGRASHPASEPEDTATGTGTATGSATSTPTNASSSSESSSGTSSTTSDAGSAEPDAGTQPSELGFQIRTPGEQDLDWLCTFGGASTPGYVYAQLRQTGTQQVGIAQIPVYEVQLAQLARGGTVIDLDNTQYDYGGGHHNDSLSFDYEGVTHRFYHSSFGFGFRACQPMDCRDVYELGAASPQQEGCADRSLAEVCVAVQSDGTHAPLTDTFMKCAGDQ